MKIIEDVKIQRTIPIHPKSKKFIHDNYFSGYEGFKYTQVENLWDKIDDVCIIHMYPDSDTRNINEGDLNGYESCLFFRAIIYNVDKMEVLDFGLYDGIDIQTECLIQHFKDMSTMITINDGCKIGYGKSFTVCKK